MSASQERPIEFPGPSATESSTTIALATDMLRGLMVWMESESLRSYDWWDLWATRVGRKAKGAYVRSPALGAFAVAPLLALDMLWPGSRALFAQKRSFPICHAQAGIGYLNLYLATGDVTFRRKAEDLWGPLRAMACPGTSGLGWGMKHDWMTIEGLIPQDTPCNTQTAYVYEFLSALHAIAPSPETLHALAQIGRHVASDFLERADATRLSCGYTTRDRRMVVNANSYRMWMLLDAGVRFGKEAWLDKGLRTLRYVLSMQQPDGSWPYSEDEAFVDGYHTCFVLKNLLRSAAIAAKHGVSAEDAIRRGLAFYFASLCDAEARPLPFAVAPRLVLYCYDGYDLAESIGLVVDLDGESDRLHRLLLFARDEFRTGGGWFAFRRYRWQRPQGIPYLRYANSAMFLALSTVLRRHAGRTNDPVH